MHAGVIMHKTLNILFMEDQVDFDGRIAVQSKLLLNRPMRHTGVSFDS